MNFREVRCPDVDDESTNDTHAYGLRIGSDFGAVDLSLAYTSVNDGDMWPMRLSDHNTQTPLFTATLYGDGDIATVPETDSYKITIGYDPFESLRLTGAYGYYDHGMLLYSTMEDRSTAVEVSAQYTPSDHISLYVAYMNSDFWWLDGDALNSIRVWAKYQF